MSLPKASRPALVFLVAIAAWELLVRVTGAPAFILPSPLAVASALVERWPLILDNALVTLAEILLGLLLGTLLGSASALAIAAFASPSAT